MQVRNRSGAHARLIPGRAHEQLAELAGASDLDDLTSEEMARIAKLNASNFGVQEDPMSYKGTMQRDEVRPKQAESGDDGAGRKDRGQA